MKPLEKLYSHALIELQYLLNTHGINPYTFDCDAFIKAVDRLKEIQKQLM